MIRYYTFPRAEVERIASKSPIPRDFLSNYESVRPGVLNDDSQDIFAPNCRTERQQWHDYSLFERVENPARADCIVVQAWLELFEACKQRQNIRLLIDAVVRQFPSQPIVFSWNHDTDACTVLPQLPPNVLVIQYNTSEPRSNDVLVPFWNVETRVAPGEKTNLGGFRGYIGRIPVRNHLRNMAANTPWVVTDKKVPESAYLKELCSWRFSLCPRGGGLSSYRLYESIQCESVPILLCDDYAEPYQELDWTEFTIQIPQNCLLSPERLPDDKPMRERLRELRPKFSLLGVQRLVHQRIKELT